MTLTYRFSDIYIPATNSYVDPEFEYDVKVTQKLLDKFNDWYNRDLDLEECEYDDEFCDFVMDYYREDAEEECQHRYSEMQIMKYIRTKDKIMKIDFEIEDELPVMIGIQTEECEVGEYQGIEVINQADTIEELCDGICAIERNGKLKVPYVGKTTQDLKVIIDLIDKDNYEVYGAIWTDKGLIYVAKMKGVLPNGKIDWELI